jgi:hypothetical protein
LNRNILLLIIAGIVAAIVILLWPKLPSLEPVVEREDEGLKLSLSPMPKPPTATPRPFIEYPNTTSTYPLTKAPSELEEQASAVLPHPLIEYSDSTLSGVLEALPSPLAALPRPLVEYANSGSVFVLGQPTGADFSQVQPHPLVEYADAGWIKGLSPPLGLLKEGE